MELVKDTFWEGFRQTDSLDDFVQSFVPKLQLRREVPEEVRFAVNTVRKLLIYSYFEYSFLHIAISQITQVIEMAFRLRYREINGKMTKMSFKRLIDWFAANGYFEVGQKRIIQSISDIGHAYSHSKIHAFMGETGMGLFENLTGYINDTYLDREERKQRLELRERMNRLLDEFIPGGCVWIDPQTSHPACQGHCVHVDYRDGQPRYWIQVRTIHDLECEPSEVDRQAHFHLVRTQNYRQEGDSLWLLGDIVRLQKGGPEISRELSEWNDRYNEYLKSHVDEAAYVLGMNEKIAEEIRDSLHGAHYADTKQ